MHSVPTRSIQPWFASPTLALVLVVVVSLVSFYIYVDHEQERPSSWPSQPLPPAAGGETSQLSPPPAGKTNASAPHGPPR